MRLQDAYTQAKAELAAGATARAAAQVQHLLRYYPRYLDAYLLLGEAALEQGQIEDAARLFTYVLAADPQNVLAQVGRGVIGEDRGQIDAAIDAYERAFEIDPSIPELRGELLRLYTLRYGSTGAAVRTTPGGLAYVHLRAGLREAAISELGYVAQGRPDRWDIEVALAEALWRNEQLDEAAALAEDILAAHPACVKCHWLLGYLAWTAGQTERARQHLVEAVAADPTYTIAGPLWAATPWPLDPAVTHQYEARVPAWPGVVDRVGARVAGRVSPRAAPTRITRNLHATVPLPALDAAEAAAPRDTPADLAWFEEWAVVAETAGPAVEDAPIAVEEPAVAAEPLATNTVVLPAITEAVAEIVPSTEVSAGSEEPAGVPDEAVPQPPAPEIVPPPTAREVPDGAAATGTLVAIPLTPPEGPAVAGGDGLPPLEDLSDDALLDWLALTTPFQEGGLDSAAADGLPDVESLSDDELLDWLAQTTLFDEAEKADILPEVGYNHGDGTRDPPSGG